MRSTEDHDSAACMHSLACRCLCSHSCWSAAAFITLDTAPTIALMLFPKAITSRRLTCLEAGTYIMHATSVHRQASTQQRSGTGQAGEIPAPAGTILVRCRLLRVEAPDQCYRAGLSYGNEALLEDAITSTPRMHLHTIESLACCRTFGEAYRRGNRARPWSPFVNTSAAR
jgi:hypothetical protein